MSFPNLIEHGQWLAGDVFPGILLYVLLGELLVLFHGGKVEEPPEVCRVLNLCAPEDPERASWLARNALPYLEQDLALGCTVVHDIYAWLDDTASCLCDGHIESSE